MDVVRGGLAVGGTGLQRCATAKFQFSPDRGAGAGVVQYFIAPGVDCADIADYFSHLGRVLVRDSRAAFLGRVRYVGRLCCQRL